MYQRGVEEHYDGFVVSGLKCLLPQITQGSYIGAVAGSLLDFENTLTVTCNSGYQLGANSINTVSCQANRTLTQLPQCVVKSCPAPETNVSRATLLTRRSTHLYGDLVEYQCDMGFTPGRTFRKCGDSGWSDLTPSCTAIQCTDDRPNTGLSNPAVVSGNYNFNSRLDLNCSQAGGAIKFQHYRFCTYNMAMDKYELQGSPYDCGEVDCGIPMAYSGTNYAASVVNTKFGSQFTFTCSAGNTRFGSSEAGDNVVRCTEDGYWDFGSLSCFGQSCIDPGVPLWGQIVATQRSFADQSTVTYQCLRPGYNITAGPTTITCQGSSWNNAQTPVCTDTEKPVIANCPSSGIVLNRYERLAGYLPILSVTDNTMVRDLVVIPRNARTTYYVEAPLTVIFTATDHAGNSASCSIPVTLRDETPPSITCPNVQIIELRIPGENRTNPLSQSLFTITDNVDPAPVLSYKTSLPTIFTENDLYKTFTYEVEARDTSNNYATCQGQIYVRPATCSELSFQTPLFSTKSCTFDSGTNTRTCTITCNDGYLTYTSTTGISVVKRKTRTFTCNSGTWSPALITSCVQDTQPPVLTCPQSQVFPLGSSETKFLNFTDGTFAGSVLDANNILSTVYTPASLSLSAADAYVARPIVMTVTDAAQRSSSCTFQHLIVTPTPTQAP
ncbi:sushi, von Willebrand factor type A, EGF and pentraxin domain-containing protein 1-like [Dreissena polymorpha]|uniref:sushi, von Willebrand factor type A, EGF and pentraxin domain-containing protein 1-like n=1 Tax=Dreissena polymorpha TaxID=45954 RepID=UPI002264543F|nr:sushi, von Willebrand factor type A, EGF and pentraxin domain-containing protein 1-like [Dreissena polymorpha]